MLRWVPTAPLGHPVVPESVEDGDVVVRVDGGLGQGGVVVELAQQLVEADGAQRERLGADAHHAGEAEPVEFPASRSSRSPSAMSSFAPESDRP